jgi:hypothetical protein
MLLPQVASARIVMAMPVRRPGCFLPRVPRSEIWKMIPQRGGIVILPSEDSSELPYEDRVANMVTGWDQVVTTVNKIGAGLMKLKIGVSMDLGEVEGRVLGVDARLGTLPPGDVFEDCVTVCDGVALVHDMVKDCIATFDAHKWAVVQSVASAETRLAQESG